MYPRTLKPSSSFEDDDDEIVADCAIVATGDVYKSNYMERHTEMKDTSPVLISRDASSSMPTTKLTEESTRFDSRNDSGFDSFRSLGCVSDRFNSDSSSKISYTRLYNNPEDCVLSSKNICIDPNQSNFPHQKCVEGHADSKDFSYKLLTENDTSPSSDVSEKFQKLNVTEQKLHENIRSTSNVVGSSQLNFWYEAFKQDEEGDTILHLAIIRQTFELIFRLIEHAPHPAFLNLQNNFRQTALHLAVHVGLPHVVRKLIVYGALPEMRDHLGNTPLHVACQKGEYACAEELLRHLSYKEVGPSRPLHNLGDQWKNYGKPQNLELRNYDGQTCIHLATICKNVEILKLLHSYGADINAQEGKSGRAPLHFAVEMGDFDLTELISINCKANVQLRMFSGFSPIQLAQIVRHKRIYELLWDMGAEYSDWESDNSSVEDMVTDNKENSDFMINGQPL